ncbi:hypothetical protein NDU88_003309 [Pleurodeles waltl]|uniref:Uncharacterized protein n=1 Tax=Pleurodeles waltl TaxID=8319 RepID=A0AAV7VCZ9_PLEWA|nr:hypothetical protein NDU88_003309 [Pleurodeles waltl]
MSFCWSTFGFEEGFDASVLAPTLMGLLVLREPSVPRKGVAVLVPAVESDSALKPYVGFIHNWEAVADWRSGVSLVGEADVNQVVELYSRSTSSDVRPAGAASLQSRSPS